MGCCLRVAELPSFSLYPAGFAFLRPLDEGREDVNGDRKDRGRVLFSGDLHQSLQIPQLERDRVLAHDIGRIGQALCSLVFALGVNDLGSPLTFRFGLLGDYALHLLGKVHVFHLDRRDLHAPGLCLLVKDELELAVKLFPLGQQIIELTLAEDAAEGGLSHHRRRIEVVLNLDNRSLLVDDTEINDGVDLHGHVIPGNDVLRRHVHGDGPEAYAHQLVDKWNDDHDTGSVPADEAVSHSSKPKDHGTLIFAQHMETHRHEKSQQDQHD